MLVSPLQGLFEGDGVTGGGVGELDFSFNRISVLPSGLFSSLLSQPLYLANFSYNALTALAPGVLNSSVNYCADTYGNPSCKLDFSHNAINVIAPLSFAGQRCAKR